jgi:dTDP-4-amino-4,6-dideoxygalactose transaminase
MKLLTRKIFLVVADIVLVNLAGLLAYFIHHDLSLPPEALERWLNGIPIITPVRIGVYYAFGMYSSLWRYASADELVRIVLANVAASIGATLINVILRLNVPWVVVIVAFFVSTMLTGGLRFAYRIIRDERILKSETNIHRKRVMIIGAGEAGSIVIKELQGVKRHEYNPVIIVDDDPTKAHKTLHGIPIVLGTYKLAEYAQVKGIDEIIIAIPSASPQRIAELIDVAKMTDCTIKATPGIQDFVAGKVAYKLVRSSPIIADKIHLASPHMSEEGYEIAYVQEAFDTNWIAPLGNNVNQFEAELAQKVGIDHAVALVSGTSAIHMALRSAGIGDGDIVFVQDLTFSATVNPILYQNAIPVFIDSDDTTWNMDPGCLEEAFQKYPSAKAVIVVHIYGLSADMDAIKAVCEKHNAILIEDAAESLGTTYKGQYTGTFGHYGIFSFNGNKIITTSGGGMLVSNNVEKIKKVYNWATQAREPERYYQHTELGYNYRMSNVVAGIGRGQLRILDQRVAQKRAIFEFYRAHLGDLEGLTFMPVNAWNEPNFWLTTILLSNGVSPIQVIEALEHENIEARHIWKPMHLQPVFSKYDYIGNNVATRLFEQGVCLPSDTKMTEKDLQRVVATIRKLYHA